MRMLFLTGDISGGEWARIEFGRNPWDDAAYFYASRRSASPRDMHTPLLIQHSERDLRTTVGQAEALFSVLRSLKRPVRFMRVPDESHELTRSRLAVPARGEPRPGPRLVHALPGAWARRAAGPAEEPRRALGRARLDSAG